MQTIAVLVVGLVVGFVTGWFLKKENKKDLIGKQKENKEKNLQKILDILSEREKVTNDDVEKLLGVSDATAERYLDELEKEGKLRQVGKTGTKVYYESTE